MQYVLLVFGRIVIVAVFLLQLESSTFATGLTVLKTKGRGAASDKFYFFMGSSTVSSILLDR